MFRTFSACGNGADVRDMVTMNSEDLQKYKARYGLTSHPGAETGNVPTPFPGQDSFHHGGFTREQWLQPDMLPSLLSQSRAAQIMMLELIRTVGLDEPMTTQGLSESIAALTFVIGDKYQLPPELE